MSTITTRAGKGSPLTNTEVDDNFTNLNTDKLESIENESLSDLSNVRTTLPTNGQVLAFNASLGSWEPQDASGGASALNDLSDAVTTNANLGIVSLMSSATGINNVAIGQTALDAITSGGANVAVGRFNSQYVTTGVDNTCVGYYAMAGNNTSTAVVGNTAVGKEALRNVGGASFQDGSYNIGIGYRAGDNIQAGENNIVIGVDADASSSTVNHEITLGNAGNIYFRMPGLSGFASDGDVMTYSSTTGYISLEAPAGGSGGGDMSWQTAWGSDPSQRNYPIGDGALNVVASGGTDNVAVGYQALYSVTTGDYNVGIGRDAGRLNTGTANTYIGSFAAANHDSGSYNVVIGYGAQNVNTSNSLYNTVIGYNASISTTTGDNNTILGGEANTQDSSDSGGVAVGYRARTGFYGTHVGYLSGYSALSGSDYNTCIGFQSGYDLDGGDYCTFVGYQSGYSGGTGADNVGVGNSSMRNLSSGYNNTCIGNLSGYYINTGFQNTMIGNDAGYTSSLTTGSNNTCLGHQASTTANSATNEITLGNSSITSLRCNVTTISALSDERDKTNIVDIPYGLDFVNDMRPVQFDWDRRDGSFIGKKAVGFIAQDLQTLEINHSSSQYTNLVDDSNPERYEARPMEAFPIMVKAIQELSAKVEALEAEIATLKGE